MKHHYLIWATVFTIAFTSAFAQTRQSIPLNSGWTSIADDINPYKYNGFERPDFADNNWVKVNIPHSWDRYEGFRRSKHGNRHGYAWYRRQFDAQVIPNKRYFLFFEGVSSYATVYVNGQKVGEHAGGRTTFTIDVTQAINKNGKDNLLAVRADHPAEIRDLPWVCGGCSDEWGFSEGSQPMGIFRPVSMIITNDAHIEPFGIHIWNDTTVTEANATLNISVELKNDAAKRKNLQIINRITDDSNKLIGTVSSKMTLASTDTIHQQITLSHVKLWSPSAPTLYTVTTQIWDGKKLIDQVETPYGIRWIQWPIGRKNHTGQFFINGQPLFINGTAEYEHLMGLSHAFTDEQIYARVMQIKAAGYNAFRDAHQPHNLRYHPYWDKLGLLWWPQMGAHIWYDTPAFRDNFKTLLRQMIKERRNSPSIILWGLENESSLPTDFAKECMQLIREMDPTAHNQRIVTTCNGGTGTDWNVVQNWSGTYGGNPYNYGNELSRQLLNGEYGAWRNLDLHTEGGYVANGPISEDRMTLLMELKIKEAEGAKDSCCGQFHWIFSSHENPGRTQNGEGLRDIDRLGPFNYKGLLTPWGEPTDAFYMYRANYAPKLTDAMVYIASHTWPNRYVAPGIKSGIIVYSNCDEVELFNDVSGQSLGRRKNQGIGTHFQWDSIDIQYNVLKAIGYVDGKEAANDLIVFQNLPKSPNFALMTTKSERKETRRALYRVNCGGPEYTDTQGNVWMADVQQTDNKHWGSLSWTDDFDRLPAFYGSQRRTFDPIKASTDWPLHQTFRYGTNRLRYRFPLPDGKYTVQLHFVEPWYGTGGGILDCKGWRLFDVAMNGDTVINDLDIWQEAGHDQLLVKEITTEVKGGMLEIGFPQCKAGQAVISAIAVFGDNPDAQPAPPSTGTIDNTSKEYTVQTWLDWGHAIHPNKNATVVTLPSQLFAAEWIKCPLTDNGIPPIGFKLLNDADVYVALNANEPKPLWMADFVDLQSPMTTTQNNGTSYNVFTKRYNANAEFFAPQAKPSGGATPWIVAVQPVHNLQQAADQRPVKTYQSTKALLTGRGKMAQYRERDFVQMGPNDYKAVTWEISTGVADVYNFHIRFFHPQPSNIKGRLVMTTMDGRIMMDQQVEFTPLKADGTWRGLRVQTPSTINAGNYKLTLTLSATDTVLGVGDLEVQ